MIRIFLCGNERFYLRRSRKFGVASWKCSDVTSVSVKTFLAPLAAVDINCLFSSAQFFLYFTATNYCELRKPIKSFFLWLTLQTNMFFFLQIALVCSDACFRSHFKLYFPPRKKTVRHIAREKKKRTFCHDFSVELKKSGFHSCFCRLP